jgi:hypothetical protein
LDVDVDEGIEGDDVAVWLACAPGAVEAKTGCDPVELADGRVAVGERIPLGGGVEASSISMSSSLA